MIVFDQAWVTHASNEESAAKALVLLRSLRRVLTSRKVVIFVSEGVPSQLRSVIEDEFDSVFPTQENDVDRVKVLCWNLPIFRKCIFLDVDCFILRNCDALFDTDAAFDITTDHDGKLDTNVFLFSPGTRTYKRLLETFGNAKPEDFFATVRSHFGNDHESAFGFDRITLKNGTLAKNETDLMIVYFTDAHPIHLGDGNGVSMGVLERAIFNIWKGIHVNEVQPLLAQQNLPNTVNERILKEFQDAPQDPIAIVGMSCRYPGANSLPEFWQLLIEGRDGIRQVTPERWTKEQGCQASGDAKTTQAGFLNCPVDQFDGKFFGISPMEMEFLDPQNRLLLEVIWESLEEAGMDPSSLKDTYTGVYIGQWTNDYKELLREQGNKEFYRTYMGNSSGSGAGRVSFILGLTGPNVATESGCSSAMVAVDLACKSLRLGETKLAIAAGVNLLLHPFTTKDMSMVCAPDGHCKTFDASADGFGRAEGCGSLILKRYSDAVNDGDHIWAVIRGTGVAQEGPSRSLGTPTVQCEALAMKTALRNAGVRANQVSYVETHGTGTPVGDPMEVAAIAQVYSVGREVPLTIGSVKTNVGHTESCSGITGIMKVVLALQHEMIPPHRNFETLNPHVKLEAVPAEIPLEPRKWERNSEVPRIAGVSSFGITGTDAHAVIQETPSISSPRILLQLERPQHMLTISAKNETALDELLKDYEVFLTNTKEELPNIAFTANRGRAHLQHRVAITGRNVDEIVNNLQNNAYLRQQVPDNRSKLCFLFTGQGSQYPGMAKSLYESAPIFRLHFDRCDAILNEKYGVNIKAALWEGDPNNNNEITRTIYSQTSIFCVEYCLAQLWDSFGLKPDCVLGHSLGEFAAATSAGILSFEDALELVAQRSRLIDSLPGGKMVAVKAAKKAVDGMLEKFVKLNPDKPLDYAAVNSSDQIVLAGSPAAVEAFTELCTNNKIKTHVLGSTHAFHSRDMDPILPEYKEIAKKVTYSEPTSCVYISGMDGKVLESGEMGADYWVRHTRESVKFADAAKVAFNQEGIRTFLEVGPQPVLSALTMMNCGDLGEPLACLPSLRKGEDDWVTMLGTMGKLYVNGYDFNWKGFDQYLPRKKVSLLPFYPFQRKFHWFEVKSGRGGLINGTEIHPLIGVSVPNATATKMYQTGLDLKKEEYVKDHCIGTKVIFPAAGYMEMALAAGHATTQCVIDSLPTPGTPLTVQNLMIEAPLCINEGEACDVQILVSSEGMTTVGSKVAIYRRVNAEDDSNVKWHKHAGGEFSPFSVGYEHNAEASIKDFAEINARCKEALDLTEFYDKLGNIGLKFGETFRSIKAVRKGEQELIGEVPVPSRAGEYLCHPVVIDAMIQALMLSRNEVVERLVVPVNVRKFIWLGKIEEDAEQLFVHCHPDPEISNGVACSLYDGKGRKLAIMSGAELIETTVDAILSALEQQKLSLPNLYEDAWRPTLGPLFGRVTLPAGEIEKVVNEDLEGNKVAYADEWNEEEKRIVDLSDKLTYYYVLQAFYHLGWKPEVGTSFELEEFLSDLGIQEGHRKLVRHMLNSMFVEEKILQKKGGSHQEWEVVGVPPAQDQVSSGISSIHAEVEIHKKKDFQMISAIGEAFSKILSGKESALGLLFPDDPTKVSADVFYTEANVARFTNRMTAEILRNVLTKVGTQPEGRETLRFLEIGGGTGMTTRALLPVIDDHKVKYEYTFTDISQMFFNKSKKGFEAYERNMRYKVLNIEDDPKAQGFVPHNYDFIIASNVIHATRDLSASVANMRHLLRPGGIVLLIETNRPVRHVDLIFGVLEGYWIFEDFDVRPNHTLVNGETWERIFRSRSFSDTTALYSYGDQQAIVFAKADESMPLYKAPQMAKERADTWLIFSDGSDYSNFFQRKLGGVGKYVVLVKPADSFRKLDGQNYEVAKSQKVDIQSLLTSVQREDGHQVEGILYLWGLQNYEKGQEGISQSFLHLAQILLETKFKAYPRCYVFTGGIMPVGEQVPCNPSSGTLWGLSRSLRSEQPNLTCRCIDTMLDDQGEERLEELFMEVWNEDGENQVVYRDGRRYVVRFVATKFAFSDLPLPNSNRFALTLPATKTFADLKFDVRGVRVMQGKEIELQVKAAGLNFRDVFNVLKPDKQFENLASNSVGADFAGVVTAVGPEVTMRKAGDFVVGCNFEEGALPSHIRTMEDAVVPLPEKLTFAEGCTLPAVFSTAYYCLVTIGKLQKDETILIHTASGGVGICAIQLANWLGAKIIATAGSKRKRAFLRRMGVEHVFHSRNLSFGEDIERVTGGRGVDMVLNSITGPGFKETSLKACAPSARFVEMSKLSIWQPEDVKSLRSDVDYTIVDLTAISKEEWKSLFRHLNKFLDDKMFQPVPYVRFNGVNIREALTYLQKARHVGKVVCIMPEMEMVNGEYVPRTPMFNERSTYLITGGLGGIGIEVAKWMASSGAENIVLIGRNEPGEIAERAINDMRTQGKNIVVKLCDVGDFEQCKKLIDEISGEESGLPPIRGVMHAAGCLSDAIIVNQSWDKFEKTFNAKVKGGWNLHELTMNFPLEHFVMFSSVVALFGPLGQSNHAASNSFLDALAHYRISSGLPALSINWGQWGQVGVAAGMEVAGLIPFTPAQGIAALEAAMKTPQRSQIAVLEADFAAIRRLFPQTKKYVEELKLSLDGAVQVKISSEKFWQEYDAAGEDDRPKVLQGYLETILRTILKLDKNEPIDETQNLQEMGLDSLMMVEMKNFLQTLFGSRVTVSASALQDCHNLLDLTNRLVDLIEGSGDDDDGVPPLTKDELNQLIEEDSILPPEVTPSPENIPAVKASEVKTVLITGVTGNLGPYILQEVSQRPHIEKIYCIIRRNRKASAVERLQTALKEKELLSSTNCDKIHCIEGNLGEERFSLTEEQYANLAEEVEAVIHCAVKSNHMEQYRKSEKNKRDIRSVNVFGTLRVLQFACTSRTKLVLHSSTMIAITKSNAQGKLPDEYPGPSDFHNLPNMGYAISKFVCDRFMDQVSQRGLPVKAFRFPGIAGDSKTGKHGMQDNHLMMRMISYMKMGVMPSLPLPLQILPVDTCASIAVRIGFKDEAPCEIYNVVNPNCALEQGFAQVGAELGYPVKIIEYSEFVKRLEADGENSILYPLRDLYFDEETFMSLSVSPDLMQAFTLQLGLKKEKEFFTNDKLLKFVPEVVDQMELTTDTIRRDLLYAKQEGLFKKFGLES